MALPVLLSGIACCLCVNVYAGTVLKSFDEERLLYDNVDGIPTWTYEASVDASPPTHPDNFSSPPRASNVAQPKGVAAPSGELLTLTLSAASRYRLDPSLLLALMSVESAFNPNAVSPKGATGLMQLMPATARQYGLKKTSDLFSPSINIDIGSRHLKGLLDLHQGNLPLALAAYNAGSGAVHRSGSAIPAYRETMLYVPAVLARMAAYDAAHPFGK